MKITLLISLVVVSAITGLAACSSTDRAATLPPGTYKSSTHSTTSNGTDVGKDTTTDVGYDANGNKVVSTKAKTTIDPPGLFNKQSTTTQDTTSYPN